jgi:hypothetical protein
MQIEHDPQTGRYILRIDSSLYKEADCMRYIFLKLIQGLTPHSGGTKNPVTEYGTAGHKFLQARYDGKTFEQQLAVAHAHFSDPLIAVADNEWRNIGHLTNTLIAYDMFYRTNGDTLKATHTELRFAYPFIKTDLVEVILCGTVDLVGTYMGQPVIADHKFTSSWNAWEFLAEFDLSPQLMIYKWVHDKMFGTNVGCMINGIFIGKAKPATFKRSDVINFSEQQIGNLINHLTGKINQIVADLEQHIKNPQRQDLFPPNYCACVKRYGEKASPCMFTFVCKQPDLQEGLSVADSMFEHKVYDPAKFQL